MKQQNFRIGLNTWWKTLAVILLGFYFSATTLTAFPELHHHSDLSAFESHNAQDQKGQENSKPRESGSHSHQDCQICQIQAALSGSLLSDRPTFFLSFPVHSAQFIITTQGIPQLLIAEAQSRGPPQFASA